MIAPIPRRDRRPYSAGVPRPRTESKICIRCRTHLPGDTREDRGFCKHCRKPVAVSYEVAAAKAAKRNRRIRRRMQHTDLPVSIIVGSAPRAERDLVARARRALEQRK